MSLTELHLLDGQTVVEEHPERVRAWPARTLLLLLLLGMVALGLRPFLLPVPLTGIAPADEFSAGRAMRHAEELATAEASGARAYLLAQLQALGLAAEAAPLAEGSVVARIPGSHPGGAILLTAWEDPPSGATGLAGPAVFLEVLRAALSGSRPANDVLVVLSGAAGAAGPALVVRFERLGDRGPVALLSTSRENGWFLREALRNLPHPTAFLPGNDVATRDRADAAPFLRFVSVGGPAKDRVPPDARTVQDAGDIALTLVRRFGAVPLPVPRAPDLVAFNIGRELIVSYPASAARGLGLAAAVAAAALLAVGFGRRRFTTRSLAAALGLFPLSVLLAAAAAAALLALVVRWNPGGHVLPWGTPHSAWFSGAALAVSVTAVALLDVLFRRLRGTPRADQGLAAAGLVWFAALSAFAGFRDPATAYLCAVPALLIVPAFLVLFLTEDVSRHPWLQAAALALSAGPAVLLLTPVAHLLDVAAGRAVIPPSFPLAAASATLGALVAALLLPHLSHARRRWLFPAFCLLVAAGLLVAGARVTP